MGDIPTHDFDQVDHDEKSRLETAALRKLAEDFSVIPEFVQIIQEYEEQKIAEARFVRVLDKVMPQLMHFADGGVTLRSYTTREKLTNNRSSRNTQLREEYPDFIELIELREELINLSIERLL